MGCQTYVRQPVYYELFSLCDYFLPLGARIMFIFLPSSLGISSTRAISYLHPHHPTTLDRYIWYEY